MKKIGMKILLVVFAIFCGGFLNGAVLMNPAYGETRDEIKKLAGVYGAIDSVDWVARVKSSSSNPSMSSSPNVCALWVSPISDMASVRIDVDAALAAQQGWKWRVQFVGMCTWSNLKANNVADRISVENNLITGNSELDRGSWGNPTGAPAWLDVLKFMEVAESKTLENGDILYWYNPLVERCHKGVAKSQPNACDSQRILIEMTVKTTYLAESNVSSGETSGYATTGIVSTYTKRDAATITVKKGETASVRFSHNVFATAVSKDADWSVTTSGNGWSLTEGGGGSGQAIFKEDDVDRNYFIGGPRNYANGERTFILRDERNVTFNNVGTYDFCEMMTVDGKKLTQVCARVIVGDDEIVPNGTCDDWKAEYYIVGTTNVVSKIRINNRTLSGTYAGWQDEIIYARPDDEVLWRNCYFPGAQEYAKTGLAELPGKYAAEDVEDVCHNSYIDKERFMDILGSEWTNKFMVETAGLSSPYGLNDATFIKMPSRTKVLRTYEPGDTATQSVENNFIVNRTDNVNKTYKDEIKTVGGPTWASVRSENHSWTKWCCVSGCSCRCMDEDDCCPEYDWVTHYHSNNPWTIGDYNNNEKKDDSRVMIPYNYENSAELSVVVDNIYDVVYAGETISVKNSKIMVNTQYNDVVESEYATKVNNAQAKLVAYVSTSDSGEEQRVSSGNICGYLPEKQCAEVKGYDSNQFNPNGDTDGWQRYNYFDGTYNAFDASAGDYMCFVIAVYPSQSGDSTNTDPNGDYRWYISKPACKKFAKKPSVQILGGDLYSAGSIKTNISAKHQLWGVPGYDNYSGTGGGVVTNGSWVEEGIVAISGVTGLSSGASLGRVSDARRTGLIGSADYCTIRAPLSIANYSEVSVVGDLICPSAAVVGFSGVSSTVKNRKALADYWMGAGEDLNYIVLGSDDGNIASATGKNIKLYNVSGDVIVDGGSVTTDTTRIVKASGTVTIGSNIEYNAAGMTSSGNVPKVVIYGNNIEIACNVTRVDAILIAENNVVTCQGYTGSNNLDAQERANILRINGVIISDNIDFGRTYGNSTGYNTGNAAEVVNYDTSALIWGRFMAGTSESDTMTVTYQHELAPRY